MFEWVGRMSAALRSSYPPVNGMSSAGGKSEQQDIMKQVSHQEAHDTARMCVATQPALRAPPLSHMQRRENEYIGGMS